MAEVEGKLPGLHIVLACHAVGYYHVMLQLNIPLERDTGSPNSCCIAERTHAGSVKVCLRVLVVDYEAQCGIVGRPVVSILTLVGTRCIIPGEVVDEVDRPV